MPHDGDGGSATKRTRGQPNRLKPATGKSNSSNAKPAKPVAKRKKGGEVPAQVGKKKPAKPTVEKRTRTAAADKEEEEEEEEEEKEEGEGEEGGDEGEESEEEEEEEESDEESEEDEDEDGVGIDSAAGDNEAEEAGRKKIAALKKKTVLDLLFSIVVNFKEALTRSSRITRVSKLYPRTSPKRPKVPLSFLERLRLNDHDGY